MDVGLFVKFCAGFVEGGTCALPLVACTTACLGKMWQGSAALALGSCWSSRHNKDHQLTRLSQATVASTPR